MQRPEEYNSSDDLSFLNYVYDKIVAPSYPASAVLLDILRTRESSESSFFSKVLAMDVSSAREELGIGEISAKAVAKLCDMIRTIVSHPGASQVFAKRDRAALFASQIDKRISQEHIRIYHSYQKFMDECNHSVLDFYLKVVGLSHTGVKFKGVSTVKSLELFKIFQGLLPLIDSFLGDTGFSSMLMLEQGLHKFNFDDAQIAQIADLKERIGHFPLFAAIKYSLLLREKRDQYIFKHGLNTIQGQEPEDLNRMAGNLGVSRERIRQLREICYDDILSIPLSFHQSGLLEDFRYTVQSDYDFKRIREEEGVDLSNTYMTLCIPIINPDLALVGDARKSLMNSVDTSKKLYLVSAEISRIFDFETFIGRIDKMLSEKRYYPYRDDLEMFVRNMVDTPQQENHLYDIVKECRLILQKGYPDNIINSQIYFPANSRKAIPFLIEDILREFDRPMTADEISEQMHERYPDLKQVSSKIGANALRNKNIVAVGRSSTYALVEWNDSEKRGGTIRDIVEEYLDSLMEPIAPLSAICEYISNFRSNVKENNIKYNLWAESSNKFSIYYKENITYIGYSEYAFDKSFVLQEKKHGRRTFSKSISLVEKFIQDHKHFPSTISQDIEEKRLARFLSVCRSNVRKGNLALDEQSEIKRLDTQYGQYKGRTHTSNVEPIPWMKMLEKYAAYITQHEELPPVVSDETFWYNENKILYDSGQLAPEKCPAFSALIKIVERM